MRRELRTRLAPLHGGDGEQSKAILAIAKSRVVVNDPMSTRIDIISPSLQSFEAWGVTNADNRRVIPNSRLRHQTRAVNDEAAVRMQSEAWEDSIIAANWATLVDAPLIRSQALCPKSFSRGKLSSY